jgi:hypothetical protein
MEDVVGEITKVFATCSGSHVANTTSANGWFITYVSAVCQSGSRREKWTQTSWNATALSVPVIHANLIFGYFDMRATNLAQ